MKTLCYGFPYDRTVECLDWGMVDNANGDLAERPPHGRASRKALAHAPNLLATFIHKLRDRGLQVVGVRCGQGLTDHVDLIEATLARGVAARSEANKNLNLVAVPPRADIIVYRAPSTCAGEDSGNWLTPDPRMHAAKEARRPPGDVVREVD